MQDPSLREEIENKVYKNSCPTVLNPIIFYLFCTYVIVYDLIPLHTDKRCITGKQSLYLNMESIIIDGLHDRSIIFNMCE
ncbi:MAG: hypothetical protein A2Y71_12410 [Bacteroidetes bacterium RBG_13_42_15]|nr:MAG: hypothetical protein A2Y71_12410 [Bacteroidetes bacterium RBG_13_42_15]